MISKKSYLKNYLYTLLWILIPFGYFAFYAGQAPEDRYLFYIYPAIFYLIGMVFLFIYQFFKKAMSHFGRKTSQYNSILSILLIFVILITVSIHQIQYADKLIKLKSNSYIQFRQAGNWIKENSDKGDKIIAAGQPQLNYYSERDIIYWPEEDGINELIENKDIKYIILSILEQTPPWTYQWPEKNQDKVIPVQAYTDSQQRPVLVIYEVKK